MYEITYRGTPYKIKFRHERKLDGDIILPKGGKTVAYILLDKDSGESISAESLCSKKDTFDKAMGRRVAAGRLKQKLYWLEHPDEAKVAQEKREKFLEEKEKELKERNELQKKVWE